MARPEHAPSDDPCSKCGLAAARHRKRIRPRSTYWREREWDRERAPRQDRIIGIDGEGQGRSPHKYIYLAGADEKEQTWSIENQSGFTTKQCLDFILRLPDRALIVSYAFIYDLTKILVDLPNEDLFKLFHEETRAFLTPDHRIQYHPVLWEGYSLNFMNRRLSVRRFHRRQTVWDIFRFFQGKFTQALKDWKIGDVKTVEWLEKMKEQRAEFDRLDWTEIKRYCKMECFYLAQLGRQLINAHKAAGLELKHFYGAGSTASAFLTKVGVKKKRGIIPEAMRVPVASAFFGGRFENSRVGVVEGRVYNYDISSAYPYQATFLPCLKHGSWEFVNGRSQRKMEKADLALVEWEIPIAGNQQSSESCAFGPFPVRARNGTIAFPLAGKGGWCWKDEYLQGRELADVKTKGAWIYHTDCACRPFGDIPNYYRERLKLGKDAKGIVLKLGLNSIYGKLAQSKGLRPPYQSWVWAGNITSGCRAQLLEGIRATKDPWNLLMFATDGIWSKVPIAFSKPKDTGTFDTAKPLGGWEEKVFDRGVFCVRPGIYFPMAPTEEEIEKVRARGLGRKVLYEHWPEIVDAWRSGQKGLEIGSYDTSGKWRGMTRFVGAKSALSHGEKSGYRRGKEYGEWVPYPIKVSFGPAPKREFVLPDGRLSPWEYLDFQSYPYNNALRSPEKEMMMLAETIAEEQPNADLSEMG